jgi:hypothetical protein
MKPFHKGKVRRELSYVVGSCRFLRLPTSIQGKQEAPEEGEEEEEEEGR